MRTAQQNRSIPACTGEPSFFAWLSNTEQVYPRVYGGTAQQNITNIRAYGLSPRVRGNRPAEYYEYPCLRSIPACTGEPGISVSRASLVRVYPRVYGGTGGNEHPPIRLIGLSPRVRGNLPREHDGSWVERSIPACTGEPGQKNPKNPTAKVYPRVYGGTRHLPVTALGRMGLSPRVRGNQGL